MFSIRFVPKFSFSRLATTTILMITHTMHTRLRRDRISCLQFLGPWPEQRRENKMNVPNHIVYYSEFRSSHRYMLTHRNRALTITTSPDLFSWERSPSKSSLLRSRSTHWQVILAESDQTAFLLLPLLQSKLSEHLKCCTQHPWTIRVLGKERSHWLTRFEAGRTR